jgi:hypothetical protein
VSSGPRYGLRTTDKKILHPSIEEPCVMRRYTRHALELCLKGQELCIHYHGLQELGFEKGGTYSEDQTGRNRRNK